MKNAHLVQYEGFGPTPQSLDLTEDHAGGLQYKNFRYVSIGASTDGTFVGINPKSPQNVAAAFDNGTFTSPRRCTRLTELSFGCTLRGVQATVNLPVGCVLTIDSLKAGDEPGEVDPIKTQRFSYLAALKFNENPIQVYSDMITVKPTMDPAIAYQLTVRSERLPGQPLLISLLPQLLQNYILGLFDLARAQSISLFVDNVKYTTDVACPRN